MDAKTAYAILQPLNLSKKAIKDLQKMLSGEETKSPERNKVLTVSMAKADFKRRLKKMVG